MSYRKNTWFDRLNVLLYIILAIVMIVPFLNVLTLSLEPAHIAAETGVVHLFPREFTLEAYSVIWEMGRIRSAFANSAFITLVGSVLAVAITGMMGYALAQRKVPGMRWITYMVLLTMVLKTGIMPSYLLIKDLGLIDNLWALILPQSLVAFNLILMKVFFEQLPAELSESAMIDGSSEIGIFFRIIVPISTPIVATIALFYAVAYWNEYFQAVMYMTSTDNKTLQVILREILIEASGEDTSSSGLAMGANLKMATTIYAIVPILFVYPFLQKHFAKGILLGAVKG